jgi:hypothetical protein
MKTTIRELKWMIAESIKKQLFAEADATKIPPQWISTYAFIQAYNDALAQGLFPRNQRMDIEFTSEPRSQFRNGTLFASLTDTPTRDFFTYDAGHDVLHGLTQNLQPHFSTFKSNASKSTGNSAKFSARDIKKFFEYVKNKHGFDLKREFPRIPKEDQLYNFVQTVMRYIEKNLPNEVQAAFKRFIFKRDYFTQRFDHEGELTDKGQNPTHAIEEEMGNIISDGIASALAANAPITPALIEELKQSLERYQPGGEFPMFKSPEIPRIIERWRSFLTELMPSFFKLYNSRLSRLKASKFGANVSS